MFYRKLSKQVEKLNKTLELANIREIMYVLGNKKKMFLRNILAGIGRGIGIGIGVTIMTAIIVYVLQKIVTLNIPVLGQYIADIVEIVERSGKY